MNAYTYSIEEVKVKYQPQEKDKLLWERAVWNISAI